LNKMLQGVPVHVPRPNVQQIAMSDRLRHDALCKNSNSSLYLFTFGI